MAETDQTMQKQFLTPSWSLLPVSFNLYRSHIYSLLWLVIIPSVLYGIGAYMLDPFLRSLPQKANLEIIARAFAHSPSAHAAVGIMALAAIWYLAVYPATYVMATRSSRGAADSPWTYFRQSGHYWWRIYGLTVLIIIAITVGLILLIVPGLIFIRRYILAPYYLVERDSGILEAMRTSATQTKPVSWYVWGTLGVSIVISFASGVFGDIPFAGLILAPAFSAIYFFGMALRQKEISELNQPAKKHDGGKNRGGRRRKA